MLHTLDCQLDAFLRANAVSRNGLIIALTMNINRKGYTWKHENDYWYLRNDTDTDKHCAYISNNSIWYTLPNKLVPGYTGEFPNSRSSKSIIFDISSDTDSIVQTVNTALAALDNS
jgi:hypothetical protein